MKVVYLPISKAKRVAFPAGEGGEGHRGCLPENGEVAPQAPDEGDLEAEEGGAIAPDEGPLPEDIIDETPVGDDGDVGETTIYITPVGGATSEFFRLEAK